ncbi:ferritin-like domain-containing protein [Miniphocaeibacter halophilus]|uniref:Ferritin family protein n=1 Tax=Miniphocaeibacter halophilus TaxID=2931922 RepID=A0AC61MZW0_9FIRM|nr:ferritin family protein [Miniphocaeibacter halophilus]QQK08985.1 ferritin family protein [Miniphocaeibacter halophilus]
MNRSEFNEIIDYAINEEVMSYEFYTDAANKIKDETLKETFTDLAKEELEHKKFLEDFKESHCETIDLEESIDYKIADTIDKPELTTDMNFQDAIALAIKREEEAMDMYQALADAATENDKKSVFVGLRNMEQMHKTRLEDIYINVGYREVW